MNYTDATIELIELLSCLVFDEPGQIDFFESEHRALDLASIIFWVLTTGEDISTSFGAVSGLRYGFGTLYTPKEEKTS